MVKQHGTSEYPDSIHEIGRRLSESLRQAMRPDETTDTPSVMDKVKLGVAVEDIQPQPSLAQIIAWCKDHAEDEMLHTELRSIVYKAGWLTVELRLSH